MWPRTKSPGYYSPPWCSDYVCRQRWAQWLDRLFRYTESGRQPPFQKHVGRWARESEILTGQVSVCEDNPANADCKAPISCCNATLGTISPNSVVLITWQLLRWFTEETSRVELNLLKTTVFQQTLFQLPLQRRLSTKSEFMESLNALGEKCCI